MSLISKAGRSCDIDLLPLPASHLLSAFCTVSWSSFIPAPDKEPPAPLVCFPPNPGLPAVALVTGAALGLLPPAPNPAPLCLPPACYREGAGSWPSFPFSAKTLPFMPGPDRPDNARSWLP